jgi:hypothetical protein
MQGQLYEYTCHLSHMKAGISSEEMLNSHRRNEVSPENQVRTVQIYTLLGNCDWLRKIRKELSAAESQKGLIR